MADPVAEHSGHLPMFITGPGETDVLFVAVAVLLGLVLPDCRFRRLPAASRNGKDRHPDPGATQTCRSTA